MANNRRYKNKKPAIKNDYNPPYPAEILAESIEGLKLRAETLDLLKKAGITTVRDLCIREEKDFYRIHTFNKKNLYDVKNALRPKKVAIKPTETAEQQDKPVEKAEQKKTETKKTEGKRQEDKNATGREKKGGDKSRNKYGTDENYIMTTRPPKPPRTHVQPVKEEPDPYLKVNRGGKWGFKDRKGKQVVEPIYDEVFNYKEDLCCVEKEEKFGFINRQGEVVVPISYDCATSFSEGYACVFKRDKCGYINANNEVVVDFIYDAGTPIINGECRIKKDGRWGEMHLLKEEDGSVKVGEVRWIN